MGKGVGNLNTELIADYLNKFYNHNYNIGQILELINLEILKIRNIYSWGYSFNGFLAASNDCHPTYVKYLIEKNTLSVNSINKILSQIDNDKKTTFHEDLIEKLYSSFLNNEIQDSISINYLKEKFYNRNILLIAPGSSIEKYKDKIYKFIKEKNPIIISINYHTNNFNINFVFINNSKRYNQMMEFIDNNANTEFILTSNINASKEDKIKYINYSDYLVEGDFEIIMHNATLMFIKFLISLNIKNVTLAGFDGFSNKTDNQYAEKYLSYNTNIDYYKQNTLIGKKVKELRESINIYFLTKSYYLK